MTLHVIIDEAGDTGKNGTRHFIMSSVLTKRSRNLLHTSKIIVNEGKEMKFHDVRGDIKVKLLTSFSKSDSYVMYIDVDKYDYKSNFYGVYGNELYSGVFEKLIIAISGVYGNIDAKIMIDESSQIKPEIVSRVLFNAPMNVLSFKKYVSSTNKCIQIADFVAGSIFAKCEHSNELFYNIIKNNVLCP